MASLIPPSALFRFRLPCFRLPETPSKWTHDVLPAEYQLIGLNELDGRSTFAQLRMAWTSEWLIWQVSVRGKRKTLWCRSGNPEESDGLRVWIDTRDTKQVQRATRFCHHLVFLPETDTRRGGQPLGIQDWIQRAQARPHAIPEEALLCRSRVLKSGYDMVGAVATDALTGLDQPSGARIGFFYQLFDSELGIQTLTLTREFGRYEQDPSLWATVVLRDEVPAAKPAQAIQPAGRKG